MFDQCRCGLLKKKMLKLSLILVSFIFHFVLSDNNISSICPSSGLAILAHPHLCNRFVVCFEGNLKEFQCGTNEMWNPIVEQCQPSDIVECLIESRQCPIDDPLNLVFVPCSIDCNR